MSVRACPGDVRIAFQSVVEQDVDAALFARDPNLVFHLQVDEFSTLEQPSR